MLPENLENQSTVVDISKAIETPMDENTMEARFIAFGEVAFPDADDAKIEEARHVFFSGAAALFDALEEIQPSSSKLSNIIASAGQLKTLQEEVQANLEDAEDD